MSKSEFVGEFLASHLFTKTAATPPTIPGLVQGTPEKSCAKCYHFQVYKGNLHMVDRGEEIIGQCLRWGPYTTSHKFCQAHTDGGPDVR